MLTITRRRGDDDSLGLFESEQGILPTPGDRVADPCELASFAQELDRPSAAVMTTAVATLASVGRDLKVPEGQRELPPVAANVMVDGRTAGFGSVRPAARRWPAGLLLAAGVCGFAILDLGRAQKSPIPTPPRTADSMVSSSTAMPVPERASAPSANLPVAPDGGNVASPPEEAPALATAGSPGSTPSSSGANAVATAPVTPSRSGSGTEPLRSPASPAQPVAPIPALPATFDAGATLAPPGTPLDPSVLGSTVVESRTSDTDAVRQAIRHYERAYEDLDVVAAARVWPSVDQRRLGRAFGTIQSQGLTFDRCEIQVSEMSATARCHGAIQFVPKVGSRIPVTAQQEWLFRMRKRDTTWQIEDVSASGPS